MIYDSGARVKQGTRVKQAHMALKDIQMCSYMIYDSGTCVTHVNCMSFEAFCTCVCVYLCNYVCVHHTLSLSHMHTHTHTHMRTRTRTRTRTCMHTHTHTHSTHTHTHLVGLVALNRHEGNIGQNAAHCNTLQHTATHCNARCLCLLLYAPDWACGTR